MDLPIENTYGFFRVDERCKKLERTVKMLQLKQLEKKNTENGTPEIGTNISSINGDAFDTSYAYSSKLGSEIVSSSSNIKNLLGHKMNLFKNNNNIATSSVKNSPDNDSARAIMPPPKSIPVFGNSSRKNALTTCEASISNQKHDPTGLGSDCFHPTLSVISSIKCPSSHQANPPIKYATDIENTQKNVSDITKPDRIFERWKVMINDKGQLIIKGILKDCKKNVRSKPVIRRINASVVQSCFNHIYELQGRIYDDQHELPEYIRGKFYNGFPDDWENVFQLWRSYISGGCKPSFRWPTPVTDSDDDLKSDITELPYSQEEKRSHSHTQNWHDSIPLEKTLKKLPEKASSESSKIITENLKSSGKKIQNVAKDSPKKTISLSEETDDTPAGVNLFLEKMHDQYFNNSPSTNPTIDEDISNAVAKILNNKNCSIEYIDKIIEMFNCYKYVITSKSHNSSANVTHNNSNISTTEKAPSIEHASKNSNMTYTKVQHCTPKDLNQHSVQNHSYNYDSVSKPSPSGSNVPSIGKVRRKLDKKDYDSSELSDSDTEIRRRKSPRKVSKMYKNRKISKAMSNKKQPLRRLNEDSDDDYVPKKVVYPNSKNVHESQPVNNVHTPMHEVDSEGFMKPIPKVQSVNISNNPINANLPPSKYHRQQKADSPSTITGFLANYDSCVSISEDDRRVRTPRPKLDDRRTVNDIDGKTLSSFKLKLNQKNSNCYYDSSVSITEDEINYTDNRMNGPDIKKQVLQEPNIQCFQQMLKRNLKDKTSNTGFFDKRNSQDHSAIKEQSSSSQTKEQKDFAFSKHLSPNLNDNKENTLHQIQTENQSNQHLSGNYQMSANKPHQLQDKIKPSIISVEKVSYEVDDFLLNTYCQKESIKNDSSKNKKNESDLKENNSLPILSTSNNISDAVNSKSLEIDFKMACKDVSVQLEDIKNTLKLKPNTSKNANDDKSSEKVIFGSEENPKQLMSWFPNVIKKADSTYGLIFEGKLLNEAGHVVNKKFRTSFIVKRVSLKVVKTDKNEFYQLIGDLIDTKHVIPKELHKYCINGCPGQITKFCEKWKSILDKSNELDGTINRIDMTSAPQSSRGRRILPALSYWSGERLSVKGKNTVYTPPRSLCTSLEISQQDCSLLVKKNLSNSEQRDKQKSFNKEKENIVNEQIIENNKQLKEITGYKKKKDEIKLRRSYRKRKESVKSKKQVKDSDSSSEEERPVSKRRRSGYNDAQKQRNSQEGLNNNDNDKKSSFEKNEEKKLKRGKNIGDKQNISPMNSNEVIVKYYKTTSCKNDLSEYESSILG
ncbi:uncharacterized protein [Chelonus insularis]|uniref:uncharacterized protein n=1 Tax=Chelonus insularis TaxID=460826 RepID=UPI00158BFB02|nr:uncharacterized protein LOC118073362 [Chelonus insularis]